MKNKFLYIMMTMGLLLFASCEVEDPFKTIVSDNSILINGSINNRTIQGGFGAAGVGGKIPSFEVHVGGGATSVTITNRYRLEGGSTDLFHVVGTYTVTAGVAAIPDIALSELREGADPVITGTANDGSNVFLIDAGGERRVLPVTFGATFISVDDDIYTPYISASITTGIPSFEIRVTNNLATVTIVNRYTLPGPGTGAGGAAVTKDQTLTFAPALAVDGVTGRVTVPGIALAALRQPADPAITSLSDCGTNYIRITAGGVTKQYTIVWE
jgi:hypothetical protein